ncbi:probable G-protein coupled receptor 25 [Chanos chanos]|uniref:Probable G-protein coupled receptor 25 n=1 Tax=Chanos chanos TaxID=29144 RepID=A0A6J2VR13_CHACN|nr:probable G-protein coupled receptor 25 [Chanos chanos]
MASVTLEPYYDYDENYTHDYEETSSSSSPSHLPWSHIYLPALYFLMFFVGVFGNFFVIVVMASKRKRSARLVDTFVLNLAVADLVFVLTLPLWAVSAGQHHLWPFGDPLCKISSYIIAVNRFSNIFFLTCMSIDRYLAVVRLMDSRFLRSNQCMKLTCVLVWLTSLVLGIPSLVFRKVISQDEADRCQEDMESVLFQAVCLLTIVLTFMLPVFIILFCYGSILAQLRHHCKVTSNGRAEARHRHSVKIVFTIITAFVVSWLPFNVFKCIWVISEIFKTEINMENKIVLSNGLILSSCLAFLNSCVNPVIYLLLDHHFRRRARNLCLFFLGRGGVTESYISSNSLSNGTSESLSGTTTRSRLHSVNLKT